MIKTLECHNVKSIRHMFIITDLKSLLIREKSIHSYKKNYSQFKNFCGIEIETALRKCINN